MGISITRPPVGEAFSGTEEPSGGKSPGSGGPGGNGESVDNAVPFENPTSETKPLYVVDAPRGSEIQFLGVRSIAVFVSFHNAIDAKSILLEHCGVNTYNAGFETRPRRFCHASRDPESAY